MVYRATVGIGARRSRTRSAKLARVAQLIAAGDWKAWSESDLVVWADDQAERAGFTLAFHAVDMLRSAPGWPDRVYANPDAGRLLIVEFKREHGPFRPGQREWLDALRAVLCQHCGYHALEVFNWQPSDVQSAQRVIWRHAPDSMPLTLAG
jgi:hypothetical protein